LAFGNQAEGTRSSALTETLTNQQAVALIIGNIAVSGSFAQTGGTCQVGTSLGAGANCSILIAFSPTAVTAQTGKLTITDNASNSPQTASLSGTGIAPVTVSSSNLNLGTVPIGNTSAVTNVILTNQENIPLAITTIATSGPFAVASNTCGSSVGAGATCAIGVAFSPTALGSAAGALTFTDAALNSPQTVTLAGSGSAPVTLSPTSLTFASTTLGSASTKTITLTNNLNTSLSVGTIGATGDFAVSSNTCGSPVSAGLQCQVGVTFTPTLVGTRSGALTINYGAFGSPTLVSLSGIGNVTGLTSLTVTAPKTTIPLGTSQQYSVTGKFSSGSTLNLTAAATWSSSAPGVATISASAFATSVATGVTSIQATVGTIHGSASLTVSPPAVVSIALTPASPSIPDGSTLQFTAIGTFTDNSTQNITSSATWSSSSTSVAIITATGLASAASLGSTTIQASSGGVQSSTKLTVTTGFLMTGSLNTPRYAHTATMLNNGLVLIAGGVDASETALSSAELYNPATGLSTPTGSLNTSRAWHTATLLNSGLVLVAGGCSGCSPGNDGTSLSQAEIYNPATGIFTPTGNMTNAREYHTATVLNNGMVLIAGGLASGVALSSAELYNPATGSFTASGSLNNPRYWHASTLLNNGTVLITGGQINAQTLAPPAGEIFNPSTNKFTLTATTMTSARSQHTATPLNNGGVLIAGGNGLNGPIASAEIYKPVAGTFSVTGSLNTARSLQRATLMNNGRVLIAGGLDLNGNSLASAELFDSTQATFLTSLGLNTARFGDTATLLSNGLVLTAGGIVLSAGNLSPIAYPPGMELFQPASLTPPSLISISVTPASPTISKDAAENLVATGTFTGSGTQTLGSVTWSSSNSAVAVTNDSTNSGAAYAAGSGSATISACEGSLCGSTVVTAGPPALVSIAVSPALGSIAAGISLQYTATGTYTDGSTQNLTDSVAWTSSKSVATISSTGLATGVSQGSTTIAATLGTVQGSTTLTITAPVLTSISVTPSNPSIALGLQQQFTATGTYTDGSTKNITASVTWGSSTGVATINSAGLATSATQGGAMIAATFNAVQGATSLTVTAPALKSIAVAPVNSSIALGLQQQFTATGTYTDGSTQNLTATASWSSSNGVAKISAGLASSVSQGPATIAATVGTVQGSTTLTITAPALTSISVTPSNPLVALGLQQQFTATGTYTDGSTQNVTGTVNWSSSSGAAKISTGLATGVSQGGTTITATLGTVQGSTTLTITAPTLTSISVTPSNPSIALGLQQQFTATGTYTDGSTQNLTAMASWSSSTGVAKISAGLATSVSQGGTTIAATLGTVQGSTTLTISAPALTSISVTPVNPSIALGLQQQFTATGTYTDGSTQNLTASASWSSSSGVAKISAGLATGASQGPTTIAATLGTVQGSTTLTITAPALTSISVTPSNPSIAVGLQQQFTATGTYTDGSTQNLTATASWSSSTGVAKISAGLATSVSQGSTTIAATLGTVQGSTTLTVTAPALTSISVTPSNPSIALGLQQQFTATGTYTDGSTQNVTGTVSWSSSATGMATINAAGLALSVAPGGSTIQATSGSVQASTLLTVTAPVLVSIAVTPANPSIPAGNNQQFTATGTYTDGSTRDLTVSATWTSSAMAMATINATGLATSLAQGGSTIQATTGTVQGSTLLTINAPALVSIALTPTNTFVPVGNTQQFIATGTYTDSSTQNVTSSVAWSSSATGMATIDIAAGLATGVAPGTTTISAASGSITASTGLTVFAGANFYVAPTGNDQWSGTLPSPNATNTDGPFASPAMAQSAMRNLISANPAQPLSIMLRNGTYYLTLNPTSPGTLNFTAADSGSANALVTWQNYPGETPVVSGGIPLGSTWINVSGNLWQAQLPANTQPFEHLFYNGQRRLRSRVAGPTGVGYYMNGGSCYSTATGLTVIASLCNLGTFLRVAAEIAPTGPDATCPIVTSMDGTQSKCLDRFGYNPNDPIGQWINLNATGSLCGGGPSSYPVGDIELTLFDAWTVDVMRISCVDTTRHIIYLTGATKGNNQDYAYHGPTVGHRYVVDNSLDAFNGAQSSGQTGIWFLDRSSSPWTLNYLANSGENPNTDNVVIAQLSTPNVTGGTLISATNLNYATFQGITFEVDNVIPPAGGFNTDENDENTLPAAIDCESCQNVTFDSVVVRHTSASGLQIASTSGKSGPPASNDLIQNSAFYDIGAAGIHIGHHPLGTDAAANVVQFVTIQNNIVQGYSRVIATGEGMALGNGHDITYSHNDVTDGYHAGISICNLGCPSVAHVANGTNVITQYNHIWNVIQGITSDGGTLYYNIGAPGGSGTGNKILNNLLHDVTDSSIIDLNVKGSGYGGHGIYLDTQSAGVDVENNVVYRVSGATAYMQQGPALGQQSNTFNNNIFAYGRLSMFENATPWPQGCNLAPSPQVNVSNNLFYFDRNDSSGFYVTSGCADSCGLPYNQFENFQGNLYWRTDGNFSTYSEAFHVLTKPASGTAAITCGMALNPQSAWTFFTFSQWQSSQQTVNGSSLAINEDAGGTATVNPGFGNAGLPSDYLLTAAPVAGFNYANTNDTVLNAGRNNPVIIPPTVPQTYPTYTFTQF
jgi:hypothetical protein